MYRLTHAQAILLVWLMRVRLLRICQDKLLGTLDNEFLAKELMLAYFADNGKEISSKVGVDTGLCWPLLHADLPGSCRTSLSQMKTDVMEGLKRFM